MDTAMDGADGKTRPELPVELYTHALGFLDPKDPASLKTLWSVLWTSTYLRTAASVSPLWKPYYDLRYTQCVPEHEARRRTQFGEDHCKLYMKRRELDRRALTLVDGIRLEIPGRSSRTCVLVQELSFDVWDALSAETVLPLPKYFRSESDESTVEAAPHAFPRRYWARAMQGVIARYWAVRMWQRAVAGDAEVTFEHVLLGFSAFFGWSPYALAQELDKVATLCRQTFLTQKVVLDQSNPKFDLAKACDTIILHMHEKKWMDGQEDMDVRLLNIYPHIPLTEEISFPLSAFSKVWLFVALSRRLGMDAYPTMAPSDTTPLCCVRPRDPNGLPYVVDFTLTSVVRPITLTAAYQQMAEGAEVGVPPGMAWKCLPELSADWCFMLATNAATEDLWLYNGVEHEDWLHFEQERVCTATHAMQCACMVLPTSPPPSLIYRGRVRDMFPLDGQVIVLDVLLVIPYNGSSCKDIANNVRPHVRESEDLNSLVMRRSRYRRSDIPYVGTVVAHSMLDDYPGFELDWKISVNVSKGEEHSGEETMLRRQIFADSFEETLDPKPTPPERYTPVGVSKKAARSWYLKWSHFGRYVEDVSFENADKDGQPTRLVMTAEMRTLYPEDRIPELQP